MVSSLRLGSDSFALPGCETIFIITDRGGFYKERNRIFVFFSKKNKKTLVDLYKKGRRKTLKMAKTISKIANSLTKNVFSYKIILDTKKCENAKTETNWGNGIGDKKTDQGRRNSSGDYELTIFIWNRYIRRCGVPVH